MTNNSPFVIHASSVRSVVLRVLGALLPGIVAYVWFFGAAILVQFGFTVYELVLESRGTAPGRLQRLSVLTLVGIIGLWLLAQVVAIPIFQAIVVN